MERIYYIDGLYMNEEELKEYILTKSIPSIMDEITEYGKSIDDNIPKKHHFNNWRKPTDEEAENEYKWEYKHLRRAKGDIFPTLEHWKEAIKNGEYKDLPEHEDRNMEYRSHYPDIESIKDITSTYQHPRDADRIIRGYDNNDSMPAPIIFRDKRGGARVVSGNTRLDIASVMKVPKKVLEIREPDKLEKSLNFYDEELNQEFVFDEN